MQGPAQAPHPFPRRLAAALPSVLIMEKVFALFSLNNKWLENMNYAKSHTACQCVCETECLCVGRYVCVQTFLRQNANIMHSTLALLLFWSLHWQVNHLQRCFCFPFQHILL